MLSYGRSLGLLLVAGGLSWSHSLISVGVAFLAASLLLDRKAWPSFLHRLSLPFLLLYGLHALSYFWTENLGQWWVEMRIKLPLVFLLPATVVAWRESSEAVKKLVVAVFHASVLAVGVATLGRVLSDTSWALEEMRQGRYVPMVGGISHIYYSALAGMGLFWLWALAVPASRGVRYGLAGLYLVVLHGLALRTGLVALYLTAAFLGLRWAWADSRRLGLYLLALGVGLGLLVLLVRYFPPFQKRWQHIQEDLALYRPGAYITYTSLTRRLVALQASWCAFRCSPLWGVGIADNQDAVFAIFPRLPYRWDKEWYILPHNQFVEYALGLGLIGLGVFGLFWWWAAREKLGAVWAGWLMYWFLLLQGEAFLERQIGVTAFLWGTGLLWGTLAVRKS